MSKGAVHADGDDVGIQVAIGGKTGGDVAKFLGANPGKSQREKENDGVLLTGIGSEGDVAESEIVLFAGSVN